MKNYFMEVTNNLANIKNINQSNSEIHLHIHFHGLPKVAEKLSLFTLSKIFSFITALWKLIKILTPFILTIIRLSG